MIKLKKIAEIVNGRLVGDGNTTITGIAGIKEANMGEISFLSHVSFQKHLKASKASAIILGEDIDLQDKEWQELHNCKKSLAGICCYCRSF